jgi:hypothetical protein
VDAVARVVWDARTAGTEPRTSWDAARTKLRYSHAAVLREVRIALQEGLPLIAARLQDVEGGTLQVLDDLVSQHRAGASRPGVTDSGQVS